VTDLGKDTIFKALEAFEEYGKNNLVTCFDGIGNELIFEIKVGEIEEFSGEREFPYIYPKVYTLYIKESLDDKIMHSLKKQVTNKVK